MNVGILQEINSTQRPKYPTLLHFPAYSGPFRSKLKTFQKRGVLILTSMQTRKNTIQIATVIHGPRKWVMFYLPRCVKISICIMSRNCSCPIWWHRQLMAYLRNLEPLKIMCWQNFRFLKFSKASRNDTRCILAFCKEQWLINDSKAHESNTAQRNVIFTVFSVHMS